MSSETPNDETGMGRAYAEDVGLPPTPKAEMWEAIEAHLPVGRVEAAGTLTVERGGGADPERSRDSEVDGVISLKRRARWQQALAWPLAAGLVLATGIALGRASIQTDGQVEAPASNPAAVATAPETTEESLQAYQVLTRKRVAGMEPLLTMLSADAQRGRFDPEMASWAEQQLTRTRLAMDRPGADDPVIRGLLEDLELIFVQVAALDRLPEERASAEMSLIAAALEEGGLLDRVRAVQTVGP